MLGSPEELGYVSQSTNLNKTIRNVRYQQANTMQLLPLKKSYNFAVATVASRDAPLQQFYVLKIL